MGILSSLTTTPIARSVPGKLHVPLSALLGHDWDRQGAAYWIFLCLCGSNLVAAACATHLHWWHPVPSPKLGRCSVSAPVGGLQGPDKRVQFPWTPASPLPSLQDFPSLLASPPAHAPPPRVQHQQGGSPGSAAFHTPKLENGKLANWLHLLLRLGKSSVRISQIEMHCGRSARMLWMAQILHTCPAPLYPSHFARSITQDSRQFMSLVSRARLLTMELRT
jgi:hypothetical protein